MLPLCFLVYEFLYALQGAPDPVKHLSACRYDVLAHTLPRGVCVYWEIWMMKHHYSASAKITYREICSTQTGRYCAFTTNRPDVKRKRKNKIRACHVSSHVILE